MNKIYLATIEAGSYLLMAWGASPYKAAKALRKEYDKQDALNVPISDLSWNDYAQRYGVRITELDKGVVEWT